MRICSHHAKTIPVLIKTIGSESLKSIAFQAAQPAINKEEFTNWLMETIYTGFEVQGLCYEYKHSDDLFLNQLNLLLDYFIRQLDNSYKTNLEGFKESSNNPSWYQLSDQSWGDIKLNLEKIAYYLFSKPDALSQNRQVIDDLIENILVCGSGVHTHIASAEAKLSSTQDIPCWLAKLRKRLCDDFSEQHILIKEIYEANAIHVNNVFYHQAYASGWSPYGVGKAPDILAELAKVKPVDIEKFKDFFLAQYNPVRIVDEVVDCVISHLQDCVKEKPGVFLSVINGIDVAYEFFKDMPILREEFMFHRFFDIDEESYQIKIKSREEIKLAIIYYLYTKEYFKKDRIQIESTDNNGSTIYFVDYPEISIIYFQQTKEEPERFKSLLDSPLDELPNPQDIIISLWNRQQYWVIEKLIKLDVTLPEFIFNEPQAALLPVAQSNCSNFVLKLLDHGV